MHLSTRKQAPSPIIVYTKKGCDAVRRQPVAALKHYD
jgi:hypothetical protein